MGGVLKLHAPFRKKRSLNKKAISDAYLYEPERMYRNSAKGGSCFSYCYCPFLVNHICSEFHMCRTGEYRVVATGMLRYRIEEGTMISAVCGPQQLICVLVCINFSKFTVSQITFMM